jgi:large subunit ribosomal protein L25
MEIIKLVAQQRQQTGTGAARRLRRMGQLPAVLYGHGDTEVLTISQKDLLNIQHSEAGENTLLEIVIEGASPQTANAVLREVQVDPASQAPVHVDLYRVLMDEAITMAVPLEFLNEPEDRLKAASAMLTPLLREVYVECLPRDIPELVQVDLADLDIGDVIRAGSLTLPPGVTLVTDPEEAVVTTAAVREEVVEEEVEEAAEAAAEAEVGGEAPTSEAEAEEADSED